MNTLADITRIRLASQQLCGTLLNTATEMLKWFGAVQGQEYAQTKWGLGLRLPHISDTDIEHELFEGTILRTHLLRPTWHFVSSEDIAWLLKLTAPRVEAVNAFMYRKLELDAKVFNKCNRVIRRVLSGNKHLIRNEINTTFKQNKIIADGLRLVYIMMHAELEGIICSGKRRCKQFTYALLEEIVSKSKGFDKEASLAELARRYFQSRGPATVKDFSTWSGLTIKECSQGIEMNKSSLEKMTVEDNDHYFFPAPVLHKNNSAKIQLLPVYDEYIMGYKNRSAMLEFKNTSTQIHPVHYDCMIIDKGQVIGTWKRTIGNRQVQLYYDLLKPFNKQQEKEFDKSVKRFGEFNNIEVMIC